jgi:hypothetical protein
MRTRVESVNLKGKDNLQEPDMDERLLQVVLNEWGCRLWIGFIWLRILPSVRLL